MSHRNDNPLGGLILIILAATGLLGILFSILTHIMTFFVWLLTISMTEFGISPEAEIFVKIATFVISYGLVGAIFGLVGGFKGKGDVMSISYFVISTLIGFALSWLIMIIQQHIMIIFWVIVFLVICLGVSFAAYYYIVSKTNHTKTV